MLFGSGSRLFEGVDAGRVALEPVRAEPTQRVTHLTYAEAARDGRIPHLHVGRHLRFTRADLETWVHEHRQR